MAYDEELAERVRRALAGQDGVSEKRMFGGLSFLLNGNMCCGVLQENLVVRLGPEEAEQALTEPHVRPMDFTGRPLSGFLYVGPDGTANRVSLERWVGRATQYAALLPPK
jgi:TfoX/Sxy family transcriptional regulator of competence genes